MRILGMFFFSFWGWVTWGWDAESPLASVGGISFVEAGGVIVQSAKESFYLVNGGVSRFFLLFLQKYFLRRAIELQRTGFTGLNRIGFLFPPDSGKESRSP